MNPCFGEVKGGDGEVMGGRNGDDGVLKRDVRCGEGVDGDERW